MTRKVSGKLIIFSAPSGAGKTTIVHALMEKFPQLAFSRSSTSRAPRGKEVHVRAYYFPSDVEFLAACEAYSSVDWEVVYQ